MATDRTDRTDLRTVAVVLAGGSGSRVGHDIPKQLLKVAGRTIIEHTVEALHACPEIDEILVVMARDFVVDAERLLLRPSWPKVSQVLAGGDDRGSSTRRALDALGEQECNVLFHDAVRPLLSRRVVSDCVAALAVHQAIDVAVPSADTIVRVDAAEAIADIPDRSRLRRGQTPQGFRLSLIRRAYALAEADGGFTATDDCGVVLHFLPEVPIHVVRGEEQNIKVTYPVDLFILDKLFQLRSRAALDHTPSERADLLAGRTVVVIGGSYGIGADVARLAEAAGCDVFAFGRSTTGTHVEDPASVEAALAHAHERTGRIDAVVVTAALLAKGPLMDMAPESVRQQLDVNLLGPINVARAAKPYLSGRDGSLVFFTSSSYTRGRADYVMYSAAKAAVVNLTQALADEWADDGIRVNAINPERTRTPMRAQAFGEEPDHTLLASEAVAATTLDVLIDRLTGQVVDVRLSASSSTPEAEAAGVAEAERVVELESRQAVTAAAGVPAGR